MTAPMLPTICPACGEEIDATLDIDHVAIDRALQGDRAAERALNTEERREAARTAVRRGMTPNKAATLLRLNGDERRRALGLSVPCRPRYTELRRKTAAADPAAAVLDGTIQLYVHDPASGVKGWTRGALPGNPSFVRVDRYAVELARVTILDQRDAPQEVAA